MMRADQQASASGAAMSPTFHLPSRTATFHGFLALARGRLVAAAFVGGLTQVCAVGLLAVAAWLISRAAQMPPLLTLSVAIVGVRAFGIGRGVLRYAERLIAHDAVLDVLARVRARVFESMVAADPQRTLSTNRSDDLVVLVRDVDELQYLPLRVYLPVASAAVAVSACVALQMWIDPVAGVVLALFALASSAISWWASHAVPEADASVTDAQSRVARAVHESMLGAADLAALSATERALVQVASAQEELELRSRRAQWAGSAGSSAMALLQALALFALACRLVPLRARGEVPAVWLASALLLPLALSEALNAVTTAAVQWRALRGSLVRVDTVLSLGSLGLEVGVGSGLLAGEMADASRATATQEVTSPPAPAESNVLAAPVPALQLSHISARWPGASAQTLDGISIVVPQGSIALVTGNSGSGKSTLVSVIAGLLPVESGRVLMWDIDLVALSEATLRQRVAIVQQEAHVFTMSLAENIRLASPPGTRADDEQIWQALRAVGLGDWANGLPHGIGTIVGSGGVLPSGGQRQRIALARLLVTAAELWVLDEPTEFLDRSAAAQVMRNLRASAAERAVTIIVASHHSEDGHGASQHIHLSRGRVVAAG